MMAEEGSHNNKICSEMEESEDNNSVDDLDGTEKLKCRFCMKTLTASQKRDHETTCSKEVLKYQCHICNRYFKHPGTLNGHIKRHALPGGFVCRYCGDRFCTEETRRKHREENHKVFKCQVCKGLFETTESYIDHVVTEHDGRDREYYICENCGQQFKSQMQLNTHKQSKCGTEKFFKCDECGLNYMTQATLNAHKYIHKGEKLHCCAFCGKSFLSKGQLTVHERKHTGERPYNCTLCDKSFSYRESLVTHSSIHTGVKPYICECCQSRFSCIGNLLKHRRARPATCGLPQFDKNVKAAPRASSKVPGSLTMNTIRIKPTKVLKEKVRKKKSKIKLEEVGQQPESEQLSKNPNEMIGNRINITEQNILKPETTISEMEIETLNNNPINIQGQRVEFLNVEVFEGIGENDDDFVTENSQNGIKLIIRSKDDVELAIQEFEDDRNTIDQNDKETLQIIENDDAMMRNTNNEINSFENAVVEELNVQLQDNCDKINVNQAQCMDTDVGCGDNDVEHLIETNDAVYTIIEKDKNEINNDIHSPTFVESYDSNEENTDILEDMPDSNFESEHENINAGENVKIELYEELVQQSGECNDPEWIYDPPSPAFDKGLNDSSLKQSEEQKNKKKRKKQKSDKTYFCPICPKRYRQRITFIKHIQNHHRIELVNMDIEYTSDDNTASSKCKYCNKTYMNKSLLEKHQAEHGPDGKLIHKCAFCKAYFETIEEAAKHSKETHADRVTCDICHGVYAGKESLNGHKRYAHPKNADAAPVKPAKQTFICPKCGKKFSTRTILSDHERSDCGKAPLYKCVVCEKSYHSLGSLKTHQTVHTGDLPFLCYCGKAFRTQGQVRVHQRSHSGEKPFKCEICPKAFAYRESLLTHVSMHTGIRRFLCQTCGLRFSCISNLQAHRRARKLTCGAQPNMTKPVGGVMGVAGGSLYVGIKDSSE